MGGSTYSYLTHCITDSRPSANLNKSYFTDRQDRYIHFSKSPSLAQYCYDFLRTVAPYTFKLLPEPPDGPTSPHSYHKEDYFLAWQDANHPHEIHSAVRHALTQFQTSRVNSTVSERSASPGKDVLIFPLVQGGQFGIREEEEAFQLLFQHIGSQKNSRLLLDLTSGYFSLYKPYQNMILSAPNVDCRIVAASPQVRLIRVSKLASRSWVPGQWFLRVSWSLRSHP